MKQDFKFEALLKDRFSSCDFTFYPDKGRRALVGLKCEEDLILSARRIFEESFLILDPNFKCEWYFKEEDFVLKGQTLCLIDVDLSALLKAQKISLYFLSQLSGRATYLRCFVNQISSSSQSRILAEASPSLKELDEEAIFHAGALKRDTFLVDKNFVTYYGGVLSALHVLNRKVEQCDVTVEAFSRVDVLEALEGKASRVLLDEFLLKDVLDLKDEFSAWELKTPLCLENTKKLSEEYNPHFLVLSYCDKPVKLSFEFDNLTKPNCETYL